MRRSRQEITDKSEIADIIGNARTARLGLNRDGAPYIVPMNFGFRENTFYFHCAGEGLKLELLTADPRVCIEIDESTPLVKKSPEKPCSWGIGYRSVIAVGKAEIVTDFGGKKEGLNIILNQFERGDLPDMSDEGIRSATVFRVRVETMTAKRSG